MTWKLCVVVLSGYIPSGNLRAGYILDLLAEIFLNLWLAEKKYG